MAGVFFGLLDELLLLLEELFLVLDMIGFGLVDCCFGGETERIILFFKGKCFCTTAGAGAGTGAAFLEEEEDDELEVLFLEEEEDGLGFDAEGDGATLCFFVDDGFADGAP